MRFARFALAAACVVASPAAAQERSALDRCLAERGVPRAARFADADGALHFGRVASDAAGVPTAIAPLLPGDADLAAVMDRVAAPDPAGDPMPVAIPAAEGAARICSPVPLAQAQIDAGERVIVAAGLNYAAHAEESGGGDVFLFPKPAAPTRPYGPVVRHADVVLLDYEVELGIVLLADLALDAIPSREAFLAQTAYFVANEVTDREPIIENATVTGPGDGFVDAKGRSGFLPAGPWLVRGTELFAALADCGAEGLGISLAVDEGDGFALRQSSTTERMLLDPLELLAKLAADVREHGIETPMPARREGGRHYPLAVDAAAPRLPAGSVILTGTPEGVAVHIPGAAGLVWRGLLHFRSPYSQLIVEERERALAGAPGGYLAPGDRVRSAIDGLGVQTVRIADAGDALDPSPCGAP